MTCLRLALVADASLTVHQPLSLAYRSAEFYRYTVHWLLGLKITHNREARTISLSQTLYINAILSRFSLDNAKPVATPIVPGASLSKADGPSDNTELMQRKKIPYREAVGSLMYAAVATRPDITFAVSALS